MPNLSLLIAAILCVSWEALAQLTFLDTYQDYQESVITDRRFKHHEIKPLILALPDSLFEVKVAGRSIEGREIYLIEVGRGSTKVLLWSQMHGNEPTATMAIFDIFNYLTHASDDSRQKILTNLTLYFIPMLNPDGAEKYQRRNAIDIDLNRDALRLQCPESKILKEARDAIEPRWGFNLHDQNHYSSAGKNPETASISFLAPAYNETKEWNTGRTQAMQLICKMNDVLQKHIPNKVGRYSDEFEPRAFGDNIQKWGTNTILIETGGLQDDEEKQYLRSLNYEALLQSFLSIATKSYEKYTLKDYNKIPFNRGVLHDLIIRNANLKLYDSQYLLDLGFRKNEIQDDSGQTFYLSSYIADQGDLHNYYGYHEFDANGYRVETARIYPGTFRDLHSLREQNITDLLQEGYTAFKLHSMPSKQVESLLPFSIQEDGKEHSAAEIKLGQNPVLSFWSGDQLKALLVNGQIYDMENEKDRGLIENWFFNLGLKE